MSIYELAELFKEKGYMTQIKIRVNIPIKLDHRLELASKRLGLKKELLLQTALKKWLDHIESQ